MLPCSMVPLNPTELLISNVSFPLPLGYDFLRSDFFSMLSQDSLRRLLDTRLGVA